MPVQARWVVVFATLVGGFSGPALAAEKGFEPQERVREPTRLHWEFASGGAQLPLAYDSRRQRYQLFVPAAHDATTASPLVVFLSPGDLPLGWPDWRKPCEDAGWLFAAPYAVGNASPHGQRVRAVLDVLDDVRRRYRIDPERTYLAGLGGGADLAAQVGFALPELIGGVIAIAGDVPLPRLVYLRHRLRERLSVALVCGTGSPLRPQQERYLAPLLSELRVRNRLWLTPDRRHGLPPPATLAEAQKWLEEDRKRRQDTRENGLGETPTRRVLSDNALERAKRQLARPGGLYRAALLLEWTVARGDRAEAAEKAGELLRQLREDPEHKAQLRREEEAESRAYLAARARALEKLGELSSARQAWDGVARLADGDERKKAEAEVGRLTGLLARVPYLGLTFAGDTTTVKEVAAGGPGLRAGLRAGDVVVAVGEDPVSTLAELRRFVQKLRPGEAVVVSLRRQDETRKVELRVGSGGEKD